jgi:hypothetical protein
MEAAKERRFKRVCPKRRVNPHALLFYLFLFAAFMNRKHNQTRQSVNTSNAAACTRPQNQDNKKPAEPGATPVFVKLSVKPPKSGARWFVVACREQYTTGNCGSPKQTEQQSITT